jgi:hypothetical protein
VDAGHVQNRDYAHYDKFHVDRVDRDWKPRAKWIDAGIEAFRSAVHVRDRNELRFTVALAYSFVSLRPPNSETEIRTREELELQLDPPPPSLYLFPRGDEPWTQSSIRQVVRELPSNLLGVVIGKHGITSSADRLNSTSGRGASSLRASRRGSCARRLGLSKGELHGNVPSVSKLSPPSLSPPKPKPPNAQNQMPSSFNYVLFCT